MTSTEIFLADMAKLKENLANEPVRVCTCPVCAFQEKNNDGA